MQQESVKEVTTTQEEEDDGDLYPISSWILPSWGQAVAVRLCVSPLAILAARGWLNLQDWKLQDWKMTDEVARVENDGLEFGGLRN